LKTLVSYEIYDIVPIKKSSNYIQNGSILKSKQKPGTKTYDQVTTSRNTDVPHFLKIGLITSEYF